ncbi:MAG: monoamine oxidase, partial [Chloroflexota bacterium]|nr:monoamine oxidase [Chloroflexota bacterium]
MSDERWTPTDKVEAMAAEQAKADPSAQPDPSQAPAVPADLLAIARDGLEVRPGPAKRVLIIGGGMAGLVAAYELRKAGHDPLVLEAQGRVGG